MNINQPAVESCTIPPSLTVGQMAKKFGLSFKIHAPRLGQMFIIKPDGHKVKVN